MDVGHAANDLSCRSLTLNMRAALLLEASQNKTKVPSSMAAGLLAQCPAL